MVNPAISLVVIILWIKKCSSLPKLYSINDIDFLKFT